MSGFRAFVENKQMPLGPGTIDGMLLAIDRFCHGRRFKTICAASIEPLKRLQFFAVTWRSKSLTFEVALFRRTRFGVHRHCLDLAEAYAAFSSLWERICLALYVGIGPGLARCFGGDTSAMWQKADSVLADIFAVSRLPPQEIASYLRRYVELRLKKEDHLPFDEARRIIYEQPFYPVVTHFTFALQPSAVARLKFVAKVVESMATERAIVADLGCGAGVILCDVLLRRPMWKGHGLDISPAAVDYAERLAKHQGVAERADFCTGNISNLPYADDSLDVLIASEVIEHTPDPERVLREIARALRPGGHLILTMPMESNTPAHIQSLSRVEDLHLLCEKAGLSIRRTEPRWHLDFADDRKHVFVLAEAKKAKVKR